MEKPYRGRATIKELHDGVLITIPSYKNLPLIGFYIVFSIITLISLANGYITRDPLFALLFTAISLYLIRDAIYTIAGEEIITVNKETITIEEKNKVFAQAKTYDLNEAVHFRLTEEMVQEDIYGNAKYNVDKRLIRFDYGMKTIKFGDMLEEAEGKRILQVLRDKRLLSKKHF